MSDAHAPDPAYDPAVDKQTLDSIIKRFEAAWQANQRPSIRDYLPKDAAPTPAREILCELIMVDWHWRWKQTQHGPLSTTDDDLPQRPKIADYARQFPDLLDAAHPPRELIVEEFRNRLRFGDSPSVADYQQRFGQQFPSLADDLNAEAAQVQRDRVGGRASLPAADPEKIGKYRILLRLGEGSFGCVYRAKDEELDRDVALKVLRPELAADQERVTRFRKEARTLAQFRHANIVHIYDAQTDTPPFYIASEYIKGTDLKGWLKTHRPDYAEAAQLVATLCTALHEAHEHEVVHRDIKPGNILLEVQKDNSVKPYLADFGLALTDEDLGSGPEYAGTRAYWSPEQAAGNSHRADARSDIYSLGVVLYEMLLPADKAAEQLQRMRDGKRPKPLCVLDPRIPKELNQICETALAFEKADRYPYASLMAEQLNRFLHPPAGSEGKTTTAAQGSDSFQMVPRGLGTFLPEDASYFPRLLPPPYDLDGIPLSIRMWEKWIHETDPDKTFRVGIIYGRSGCGKSSLVIAGILPRLDENRIAKVYVAATSEGDETERKLLKEMRSQVTSIPADADLVGVCQALHRGTAGRAGTKTLLVLDQFEQWLHGHRNEPDPQLTRALRACDGARLQCILIVRDGFSMTFARFLAALGEKQDPNHNFQRVEPFSRDHAYTVLKAYGRGHKVLSGELSEEQEAFLRLAAEKLAEDERVPCVKLALYAHMIRHRKWTPSLLESGGDFQAVGKTFLKESFNGRDANPEHVEHKPAAVRVLQALLYEPGVEIKGNRQSEELLREESEYGDDAPRFATLIRILSQDLPLIIPTEPADKEDPAKPSGKHYQLSHDYMVPPLQEWIEEEIGATKQGRAQLLLAERARIWNRKDPPENRDLPSILEYRRIRRLTDASRWTPVERKMMEAATGVHVRRGAVLGVVAAAVILLMSGIVDGLRLVGNLVGTPTANVGSVLSDIDARFWASPFLWLRYAIAKDPRESPHQAASEAPEVKRRRLNLRLALLPARPELAIPILEDMTAADVGELNAIADRLGQCREKCAPLLARQPRELIASLTHVNPAVDPATKQRRFRELFYFAESTPDNTELVRELQKLVQPTPLPEDLTARQTLARQQAQAAIALVRLGRGDLVWEQLRFPEHGDPSMRSWFLHLLHDCDAEAPQESAALSAILKCLEQETDPKTSRRLDPSVLKTLAQAIGELKARLADRTPPSPRKVLDKLYRNDDASVHSAARWSLQQLGVTEDNLRLSPEQYGLDQKTKDRAWFVTPHGDVMVMFREPEKGNITFQMGTPEAERAAYGDERRQRYDDETLHRREIDYSFAMSTTEVTHDQFRVFFCEEYLHVDPDKVLDQIDVLSDDAETQKAYRRFLRRGTEPQENVDWYWAAHYCNWLSEKEKLEPCYEPNQEGRYAAGMRIVPKFWEKTGYRLPTEAEWEYACRAKSTSRYCFGDSEEVLPDYARYDGSPKTRTYLAGALRPNDFGLFDMHGSLWEWCQDHYRSDYSEADPDGNDGRQVTDSDNYSLRSGCYSSVAGDVRSGCRNGYNPFITSDVYGFRVSRTFSMTFR